MFSLVFSIQLPRSRRNQTCQGRNPLSSETQRPRKARADQIPTCPTSSCPPVLFQVLFVTRGERQIAPEGKLSTSSVNPCAEVLLSLLWLPTPQRKGDTYQMPTSVEGCRGNLGRKAAGQWKQNLSYASKKETFCRCWHKFGLLTSLDSCFPCVEPCSL